MNARSIHSHKFCEKYSDFTAETLQDAEVTQKNKYHSAPPLRSLRLGGESAG